MPKNQSSRTTRKTKEKQHKLKRVNRQEDVPECPSIEDFSVKGDYVPETQDVNPYEHELSENDSNKEVSSNHQGMDTAISSSSSPSISTPTSPSSSQTASKMYTSSSDSKLTVQRAQNKPKAARQPVDPSERKDSLLEIRATLDQSIANRENVALQQDYSKNNLTKSDGSQSAVFTDDHPQIANFHSFVEASENQSLSKIASVGGEILSKFILFSLNMLRYLSNHPTPVAILIGLISAYFIIMYLELSVATFIEMSMQFMWPTAHIMLRGAERLFKLCGNFLGQVDDLGQAVYCDLAHVWCRRFNLMCEDRCSFVEMVVDRMRA